MINLDHVDKEIQIAKDAGLTVQAWHLTELRDKIRHLSALLEQEVDRSARLRKEALASKVAL